MLKISFATAMQLFFCGMAIAQTSEREMRALIDSACSSEKYGGGPAAYARCVTGQLSSYDQSVPIPDMSGYDRKMRAMIDSACSSEKHGGGPAAYARCVTGQLSSYNQSAPIPDMSGYDRKMRAMIDSACSSEKHGGGPAAYARCVTNQLSSTMAAPLQAQNGTPQFQPLGVQLEPRILENTIMESMSPAEPLTKAISSAIFDVELSTSTIISQLPPPKRRDDNVYQAQILLKLLGYNPGPLDGQTGPRTKAAIQKFRQDSGLKNSDEASNSLLEHLRESAKTRTSKPSSVRSQPNQKIDREVVSIQTAPPQNRFIKNVKNIQLALQAFGYYSGTIDGIVNTQTSKAISALQTDYGLRVTGTITPELFSALGIETRSAQ